MALELSQVREIIKRPKYKSQINNAINHEAKIRFHAETKTDSYVWTMAHNDFLAWVEHLLPADKFNYFLQLFRYPLKTNALVADIFNEFEQIFAAKNAIFNWNFTSREYANDFEYYRTKVLKEQEIWRTEGFQALKTMINSIVVVDMPSESTNPAQPYFYFVPIENVVDVGFTLAPPDTLDYVAFRIDSPDPEKPRIAVYDDKYYRVMELDKSEYIEIIKNPHSLGYCPAKFFYSNKMSQTDPITRESEISKALEDMNWYLFFHVSKKYLDLYAPYPIYSAYQQDCDYKDDKGNVCSGGILINEEGQYVQEGNAIRKCPICSNKNLIGVGTFLEIPAPEAADDADLRDPIQRLDAPIDSLKYNTEEVDRLRKEIFYNCAGEVVDNPNEQAKNELQIQTKYESRKTILIRIKKNFDIIHKFVTDTICRLRYGNNFIDSTINYGTDYFLKTSDSYYETYRQAKTAGASDTELDIITDNRITIEYRDNHSKLDRIKLLIDLEPYQNRTTKELTELLRSAPQVVNEDLFIIKLNFSNFIARFEAENGDILEFGKLLKYDEKLQIINNQLKTYANGLRGKLNTGAA